jgi:hypothetical protein
MDKGLDPIPSTKIRKEGRNGKREEKKEQGKRRKKVKNFQEVYW